MKNIIFYKYLKYFGFFYVFYGKKRYLASNHSYVCTDWLTFLFIPIKPIATYRVIYPSLGTDSVVTLKTGTKIQYKIIEKLPLDITQVVSGYLFTLLILYFGYFLLNK